MSEAQAKAKAEALVTAFSEATNTQLTSKSDINRPERELLVLKLDGWFGFRWGFDADYESLFPGLIDNP